MAKVSYFCCVYSVFSFPPRMHAPSQRKKKCRDPSEKSKDRFGYVSTKWKRINEVIRGVVIDILEVYPNPQKHRSILK